MEAMNIPDYVRNAKAGDCLTTKHGKIIFVHHVEITEKGVCVYYYFDYDTKEKMFFMNEWLSCFYGPVFKDEHFYRPSTEDERNKILSLMSRFGYEWIETEGEPKLSYQGYRRFYDDINAALRAEP